MANRGSYETKIKISGELSNSFGNAVARAERELKGLYQQARRENGGMLAGVDNLNRFADRTFAMVAKAAKASAAGTAGIVTAAAVVGSGYKAQMSAVQSIANASAADMQKLDQLAQEMGRTTQFSAAEAGEGLEYMAMAGWKADQMAEGLPSVLNLAAASGEDLGSVSDIVTDALTAFGLQAEDTAMFADVLAQASSNSNTNVGLMGETFRYVAPVAGALNYSVQDTAVAIGLMANAGIKGSQSGTALRSMLTRLAKPTKEVRAAMDTLGLSLTRGDGSMKSLHEVMSDIRGGFARLSTAEQAGVAASLAGQEAMSGLLAIANAAPDDFDKLTDAIDHSTGAAKRMADIRLDNLAGDVTLLKSAAEGAGIGIFEAFDGIMREIVQGGTGLLGEFTESGFLEAMARDMPSVRREAKEFGKTVKSAMAPLLSAGKWFLKHPDALSGSITGIGSALLTFKAAKGAASAVKILGTLSGMAGAWPVAAAGAMAGGIIGIGTAIQSAKESAARANLAEHFGDITLSMAELDETARHIVGGGRLFGELDTFREASDVTDRFRASMSDALKEIQKSGWELSMGIEFTQDDTESYTAQVDSFIKDAQEYILSSGYELKVAVGIVMGDSEKGKALAEDSEAFYQSLYEELTPMQEALSEVMADITENGLTLDKQKLVDGYLSDISDITSMITQAQDAARLQVIQDKYGGAALTADSFENLQQSVAEYTKEGLTGADEAYQTVLTGLNAKRIAGEKGKAGGITQAEYDAQAAEALSGYYERQAEIIQNGYKAMEETILATYGDEIEPALASLNQAIAEGLPEILEQGTTPELFMQSFDKLIMDAAQSTGMGADARDAVRMLLQGMAPAQEELEQLKRQYEAMGQEIPEAVSEALENMQYMEALTGDKESIWALIGKEAANEEDHALLLAAVQQQTGQIPESAISALEERHGDVQAAAKRMLDAMRTSLEGGFSATVPVSLSLAAVGTYKAGGLPAQPEKHAFGGLMTKPTLSWFAEKTPEMAIPIERTERSLSLWEETGRMLGAYQEDNYKTASERIAEHGAAGENGGSAGSSFSPVYAPNMNFYGNTSREDVEAAGMKTYEQFCEWAERYDYERRRAAF